MIRIYVANKSEKVRFEHGSGPLELGRGPRREAPRQLIHDPNVSKDQLRVEALPGERLRVANLSRKVDVILADGRAIEPGAVEDLDLPLRCTVGETLIEFTPGEGEGDDPGDLSLRTIARPLLPSAGAVPVALPEWEEGPNTEQLGRWLETFVAVQRAAASSHAFYEQTARAVVELIGLDRGLVLLGGAGEWRVVGRYPAAPIPDPEFNRALLEHVARERQTLFPVLRVGADSATLAGVGAVVAAPVFGEPGDRVVGAIYGVREARFVAIRPLEAQFVQVLAAAVGAGLARLASETEAARRLEQFERFFSADLARELDRDPTLLEGREREVTVLVCDLRGFSRTAERLQPRDTFRLIGELMERLTARVHDHGGVVVDYTGDGLLAMWNAPVEQSRHALLACTAARAMLAEIPELSARWRERVGGPIHLGIGLNTGSALIGNTGSQSKLKYGPHGHTVNLASRVEGATKSLGIPILITGTTRDRLEGAFPTRRLCRVRVPGIEGVVDLYELAAGDADAGWVARSSAYEESLALFEAGRWSEACQKLYPLLMGPGSQDDLPTLTLLGRAIECRKAPPSAFDPVVTLRDK